MIQKHQIRLHKIGVPEKLFPKVLCFLFRRLGHCALLKISASTQIPTQGGFALVFTIGINNDWTTQVSTFEANCGVTLGPFWDVSAKRTSQDVGSIARHQWFSQTSHNLLPLDFKTVDQSCRQLQDFWIVGMTLWPGFEREHIGNDPIGKNLRALVHDATLQSDSCFLGYIHVGGLFLDAEFLSDPAP